MLFLLNCILTTSRIYYNPIGRLRNLIISEDFDAVRQLANELRPILKEVKILIANSERKSSSEKKLRVMAGLDDMISKFDQLKYELSFSNLCRYNIMGKYKQFLGAVLSFDSEREYNGILSKLEKAWKKKESLRGPSLK